MVKIAINGFGRIGRSALKIALDRRDVEVVAINDLSAPSALAHLLKHDSSYGTYDRKVTADDKYLYVNTRKIRVVAEPDPANLPWKRLGVDVVLECTGRLTDPKLARAHIDAGAKKVVLSAPAKGEGAKTVVIGVNEEVLTADDEIVSNASCTTNCIAPVMKVLEDNFGIEKAMMTTIHSYTASQRLKTPRRKTSAKLVPLPKTSSQPRPAPAKPPLSLSRL